MDIFVSNGFMTGDVIQSIETLANNGFHNIELSTGHCDDSTLSKLKSYKSLGYNFRLHNYFPTPSKPFVLNLASDDPEVVLRSRTLIQTALQWSSELEASYYAFHAGLRLTPQPYELGGNLVRQKLIPIDEAKERFIVELNVISEIASALGVNIAVENNVYDRKNFNVFGLDNPLLLTGSKDTDLELPESIGVLLDFGHLKVSVCSEQFDKDECISRWAEKISGYHISDNDQLIDSNDLVTKDSWFWTKIDKTIPEVTLEVYNPDFQKLQKNRNLIEKFYQN